MSACLRPAAIRLALALASIGGGACGLWGEGRSAVAQGVLVAAAGDAHHRLPRPWPDPSPAPRAHAYRIASLEFDVRLANQTARVQIVQTYANVGDRPIEASFVFPLPPDGAVDEVTLLADGEEIPAEVLDARAAREKYEAIVRSQRDPALLEWVGSGLVQSRVFPIPPGGVRKLVLSYVQPVRSSLGLNEFVLPLRAARYSARPLERLVVNASLDSPGPLHGIYSPTHGIRVERQGEKRATVRFSASQVVPDADFRLFFDSGAETATARLLAYRPQAAEPGYFMVLASPPFAANARSDLAPKTVVCVVDRSGSMSGEKMQQARGALAFILNRLQPGDLFNVVAYDSAVETFRPELETYSDATRDAALQYVQGLFAGGSTNIDEALRRALGMLADRDRPSYVIFLTDGLPTAGETAETAIAQHAAAANRVRARLFAFGVGYDVNSRLIDRLARENFGQSEYVRPAEDLEAAVSRLYARIGAPVMTDVQLAIELETASAEDRPTALEVYPGGAFDLFRGDQAVLFGRYRGAGSARVVLTGRVGAQRQEIAFPAELVAQSVDHGHAFVARLWATRRIGELLDRIDLEGRQEKLVEELVAIAKRHGILTPYTAFLADDSAGRQTREEWSARAAAGLQALEQTSDRSAFSQRELKGSYRLATTEPSPAAGLAATDAAGIPSLAPEERARLLAAEGRAATYFDPVTEQHRVVDTVFSLEGKTFFLRDGRWVDSEAAAIAEATIRPRRVARYSDDYFALIDKYGRQAASLLALETDLLVAWDGQTYEIVGPEGTDR